MFITLLLITQLLGCNVGSPEPTGCPSQNPDCSTIELQSRTEVISCTVASRIVCRARSTYWPYNHRTLYCTNTKTPICDRQRD
jgi:hypothetical protein